MTDTPDPWKERFQQLQRFWPELDSSDNLALMVPYADGEWLRRVDVWQLVNQFASSDAQTRLRLDALTGERAADEERLRQAGARVGIWYGCDTPDWLAEEILGLRASLDALEAENQRLQAAFDERRNNFVRDALAYRGIELEDACSACSGQGIKTYGSTATWHGGIGGQMLTDSVCDRCWGSGNKHRPWPSWRERESLQAQLTLAESSRASLEAQLAEKRQK